MLREHLESALLSIMLVKLVYIKINVRNVSLKEAFNSSDFDVAYSTVNACKALLNQRK